MSQSEQQQRILERHSASMNQFVLRARRVAAHSLADDRDKLHDLTSPAGFSEFVRENGTMIQIITLPPEEQIESAAARIRPLLLEREPSHYAKVFKAIGYFTHIHPDGGKYQTELLAMKNLWQRIQPDGKNRLSTLTSTVDAEGNRTPYLSDTELGFAYIYGDVVHADVERITPTLAHGIEERLKAAVVVVANVMVAAIVTLSMLEELHQAGVITLSEEALKTAVTVPTETTRIEVRISRLNPLGGEDEWLSLEEAHRQGVSLPAVFQALVDGSV